MQIRDASPEDVDQLVPMLVDMGFVDGEQKLRDRFPRMIEDPAHWVLVAEDEGRLLGYAAVQDYGEHLRSGNEHRTAKLDDLYTAPDARRRGVARALMDEVLARAAEQPVRYVFWYANQGEAGAAYQAMGYRPEPSGQEGFDFYEVDLGSPSERQPHPLRGS